MAIIECIGSSCLLTQMRSKNSILLADPQMAADALEAWMTSLTTEFNAEFSLAFLPNRNNRELRYGTSEETHLSYLLMCRSVTLC